MGGEAGGRERQGRIGREKEVEEERTGRDGGKATYTKPTPNCPTLVGVMLDNRYSGSSTFSCSVATACSCSYSYGYSYS